MGNWASSCLPLSQSKSKLHLNLNRDSRLHPRSSISGKFVEIPMDLVIEILSRLLTKPLVRLKCVCKLWNSITLMPRFIYRHLQWMGDMSGLNIIILPEYDHRSLHYFGEDWYKFDIVSCEQEPGFQIQNISDSCNGLICAYTYNTVYVTNPIIHKSLRLPKLPRQIRSVAICSDAITGEYKIVCVHYKQFGKLGCMVFVLGSCSWRSIEDLPFNVISRPVVVDGLVFWGTRHYRRERVVAIVFDARSETFDTIVHPRGCSSRDHHFVELGGYPCLYEREKNMLLGKVELVIWILTDYNSREWTKIIIDLREEHANLVPLAVRGEYMLLTRRPGKVERYDFYDLCNKKFEKPLYLTCGEVIPYVESLISTIEVQENAMAEGPPKDFTPKLQPCWWQGRPKGRGSWRQFEDFREREGVYGELRREQVEVLLEAYQRY